MAWLWLPFLWGWGGRCSVSTVESQNPTLGFCKEQEPGTSGTRREDALQRPSLLWLDPSLTRGWGFIAVGRPGYSGTSGSPSSLCSFF